MEQQPSGITEVIFENKIYADKLTLWIIVDESSAQAYLWFAVNNDRSIVIPRCNLEIYVRDEVVSDVIKDMQRFWYYLQDAEKVLSVTSCAPSRQGPAIFGKKPIKEIVDEIRTWPFPPSSMKDDIQFSAEFCSGIIASKECATYGEVFDMFDLSKQGALLSYSYSSNGGDKNNFVRHDIDLLAETMPSEYYMPTKHPNIQYTRPPSPAI